MSLMLVAKYPFLKKRSMDTVFNRRFHVGHVAAAPASMGNDRGNQQAENKEQALFTDRSLG
jgi:hypothetical protein